jgi:hypothetical protein
VKAPRPLRTAAIIAGLGVVPLVVMLVVRPGDRARALDVFVLFLGAVLLLAFARMTAGPRTKAPVPRPPEQAESARLPELARIEREVVLAAGSAFDQHVRISPLLRDIAQHRLWTHRGIDLGEQPERAQEALGPELWDLVRPERPNPNSRWSRGLDLAGLSRLVDEIEKV